MSDFREFFSSAELERAHRALIEQIEKSRTPEPRKITPAAGIIEAPTKYKTNDIKLGEYDVFIPFPDSLPAGWPPGTSTTWS